jgi:hypothetical protein
MYLTEGQLIDAWIDPEKIQKFAELFPDGTEVTCELCVKYPDIFSFGEQGRSLITDVHYVNEREDIRSQYDREIMELERACGVRRSIAICVFRNRLRAGRDDKDRTNDIYYPLGTDGKTARFAISRPPTIEEDTAHKSNIDHIEQEHLLKQALVFYKASRYR